MNYANVIYPQTEEISWDSWYLTKYEKEFGTFRNYSVNLYDKNIHGIMTNDYIAISDSS